MLNTAERIVVPFEAQLIEKLSTDVKKCATNLGIEEARYLVDLFYQMQAFRIATNNQVKSIEKSGNSEPNAVLAYFKDCFNKLENNIEKCLDVYTMSTPVGRWLRSIPGIGPIIAAGFLANLDVKGRPTAGHFWSYCGLNDRNRPWLSKEQCTKIVKEIIGDKKEKDITYQDFYKCCEATQWKAENLIEAKNKKDEWIFKNKDGSAYKFTKDAIIKQLCLRPYNARLKTLCWKLAQSFVKLQNNPNDIYGKLYVQRQAYEQRKNQNGELADQAAEGLKRVGKQTEAYKSYVKGMLPPKHINSRAERWTTKIFISHLHQVMYMAEYGTTPPMPFAFSELGHAHLIECPNLEVLMAG